MYSWYRVIGILFFSLMLQSAGAQYTLKIIVHSKPAAHPDEPVYIAGNFNGWRPGDPNFMLVKKEDKDGIIITGLAMGMYEFKFTRGVWEKEEADAEGKKIENRSVRLLSDTIVEIDIANWYDDFSVPGKHTASGQVHLLDTAFFIPQLNRTRTISIYLPENYSKDKSRYPVIYMNDGQNLFDELTAGFGEWGIDECMDSVIKKGGPAAIIVGINSGQERMTEYSPFPFGDFKDMEGDKYLDFIVTVLKPYIDKHYRTISAKEHTTIAGSSLGGLISYYALLKYPDVFGNAGVFSPSFWINVPALKTMTDSTGKNMDGKIFFYMGDAEGEKYVNDMKEIADEAGVKSKAIIYRITDPAGKHNETAWRKWFPEFYRWILSDGLNSPVKK